MPNTTHAGLVDGTSYQQFGTASGPDYGGGSIALPSGFFTTLKDGAPVMLR